MVSIQSRRIRLNHSACFRAGNHQIVATGALSSHQLPAGHGGALSMAATVRAAHNFSGR